MNPENRSASYELINSDKEKERIKRTSSVVSRMIKLAGGISFFYVLIFIIIMISVIGTVSYASLQVLTLLETKNEKEESEFIMPFETYEILGDLEEQKTLGYMLFVSGKGAEVRASLDGKVTNVSFSDRSELFTVTVTYMEYEVTYEGIDKVSEEIEKDIEISAGSIIGIMPGNVKTLLKVSVSKNGNTILFSDMEKEVRESRTPETVPGKEELIKHDEYGSRLATEYTDYALSFVGILPYVWGGVSLETGADCSGFLATILAKYGLLNSKVAAIHGYDSAGFRSLGTEASLTDIRIGDVVCYKGHVAMYIGDGKVVQEPSRNKKCNIGDLHMAPILSVRRFVPVEK